MAVSPPLVYVFSNKKSISQRQPFQILLKNDELNEFEESFYVYVNVTSADFQSYNLDGVKVATVVIRASEDSTLKLIHAEKCKMHSNSVSLFPVFLQRLRPILLLLVLYEAHLETYPLLLWMNRRA